MRGSSGFLAGALAGGLVLSGLALGPGCAASKTRSGDRADVGASSPPSVGPELRLTATAPSRETAPGAGVGAIRGTPELLELSIVRITNPASQSFSIKASLITPGTNGTSGDGASPAESVSEVGAVTPYPPDATGTYLAAVPSALRPVIAAQASAARLRLTLVAPSPDRTLVEPLEVIVAGPVWRASR